MKRRLEEEGDSIASFSNSPHSLSKSEEEWELKTRTLFALVCLVIVGSLRANSADLNGSFAFSGLNTAKNGTNLLDTTLFTFSNFLTTSGGTGDYVGVVTGTLWNGPNAAPTTGALNITNGTTMGGFSITNASFGTFVASNTAQNQVVNQSANFLDVYLRGMFTPAGTLSSFNATDTSLRISINLSGDSLSSAFTLNTPAVNVPEPSTYVLGIVATTVVGLIARNRRVKAKA